MHVLTSRVSSIKGLGGKVCYAHCKCLVMPTYVDHMDLYVQHILLVSKG